LKSGDMRAVQVNFRRTLAGRDVDFDQPTLAAGKRNATGDFELSQLFWNVGAFHRMRTVLAQVSGWHRDFITGD
jgi:hypothetical protein